MKAYKVNNSKWNNVKMREYASVMLPQGVNNGYQAFMIGGEIIKTHTNNNKLNIMAESNRAMNNFLNIGGNGNVEETQRKMLLIIDVMLKKIDELEKVSISGNIAGLSLMTEYKKALDSKISRLTDSIEKLEKSKNVDLGPLQNQIKELSKSKESTINNSLKALEDKVKKIELSKNVDLSPLQKQIKDLQRDNASNILVLAEINKNMKGLDKLKEKYEELNKKIVSPNVDVARLARIEQDLLNVKIANIVKRLVYEDKTLNKDSLLYKLNEEFQKNIKDSHIAEANRLAKIK